MTYAEALKEAKQVGAAKATGDAHLAQVCKVLTSQHALVGAWLYDAAKAKGIAPEELLKMSGLELDDLQWSAS